MAVRTQIYLPEEIYKRLRRRAVITGKSMAEQVRESLERYFTEIEASTPKPKDPVWQLGGRIQSQDHDLSVHHDAYLYPRKGR